MMHKLSVKHLLDIQSLTNKDIDLIFKTAKKPEADRLKGKTLINLFFENSTRTRSSFEMAALNLGAKVINIDVSTSSLKKGESEVDTIVTLNAMQPDFITIRHSQAGAVQLLSEYSSAKIINSGDGAHAHPTQGLLDAYTVLENKGKIKGLNIAICGDIINSRVARSDIEIFTKLEANVRLIGPKTLLPKYNLKKLPIYHDMQEGLKNVDVIIMLRLQKERMENCSVASLSEYYRFYGLNREKLSYAKKDAIIMHPGPMNRGIEISSDIADDKSICLADKQVYNGVLIRQSVLSLL